MADPATRQFSYIAISDAGVRVSDTMYAGSETDVVSALHQAGYTPLQVKPVSGLARGLSLRGLNELLGGDQPRLKTQDLAAFTRQLHQMLRSGIPIAAALASLAEDQPDAKITNMLETISERIVSGSTLTQAFDGFPKAFDAIFLAYLSAAEESGDLIEVTGRLAAIVDKRAEINRKVKGVTMYPLLVSIAVVIMLALILLFLVPRYASIYESFGAELPTPTLVLITISKLFPIIAAVTGGLVAGAVFYNRSQADNLEFGTRIDRIRFRIPVVGKLTHKLTLMRFCSTAGGAHSAGVQLHDALELASRASGSRWVRATVPEMQEAVRSGQPLSSALARHKDLYPANVRKMISTGEDTGELGRMLRNAGHALEDEIDVLVSTMSAKLEVALLLFMGLSVGAVLIALYLPILNLTTTVSNGYGM